MPTTHALCGAIEKDRASEGTTEIRCDWGTDGTGLEFPITQQRILFPATQPERCTQAVRHVMPFCILIYNIEPLRLLRFFGWELQSGWPPRNINIRKWISGIFVPTFLALGQERYRLTHHPCCSDPPAKFRRPFHLWPRSSDLGIFLAEFVFSLATLRDTELKCFSTPFITRLVVVS